MSSAAKSKQVKVIIIEKIPSMSPRPAGKTAPAQRLKQILWFVALWIGGVAALAALSYGIRLLMEMAGLHH